MILLVSNTHDEAVKYAENKYAPGEWKWCPSIVSTVGYNMYDKMVVISERQNWEEIKQAATNQGIEIVEG